MKFSTTTWIKTALVFFFVASLFGMLMRIIVVQPIPMVNYIFMLHAHSHLAMSGWAFTAVMLSVPYFVKLNRSVGKTFHIVLFINALAVVGMTVFFSLEGYKLGSILFLVVHLFCSYVLAAHLLNRLDRHKNDLAIKLMRWALYWLIISSIGVWCIAPAGMILGKSHPAYDASIQFFLHFQFNGFFTYAILAFLVHYAASKEKIISLSKLQFALMQISLPLTYAFSTNWEAPKAYLFYTDWLAIFFQFWIYSLLLFKIFVVFKQKINLKITMADAFILIGILSIASKIALQTCLVWPGMLHTTFAIRNFIIGYIHLVMLGAISLTLLGLWLKHSMICNSKFALFGYATLLFAFISVEVLLFLEGWFLWMGLGSLPNYYLLILAFTAFLPIALAIILIAQFKTENKASNA